MSQIELLKQLKTQLISFLDELIEMLPEEADLIIIRIFLKDKLSIEDVMKYVVKQLVPLKQMVEHKDEGFFLNHNILFEEIDSKKVNHFKRIWRSNVFDKDDRETLWAWFKLFISLGEKYQKLYLK